MNLQQINANYENNRAARELLEVGRYLALSRNRSGDALLFARQAGALPRVVAALQTKASAGSTEQTSGNWGGELVDLSTGFVQSLSHSGVFDRALSSMVQMPTQCRISVVTGRATGNEIAQGALKLVSEIELSAPTLAEQKAVTMIVCTDELLRLTGTEGLALLQGELRSATAGATDEVFISALILSVTPIPSTGDPLADLAALSEAITTGDRSKLFLVVSPLNAKRLSFARTSTGAQTFPNMTPTGGTISGVTVLVSDEIADDTALMFDAASIAANGGRVDIEGSSEALINMGEGDGWSLYQRNLRAMKCIRHFGFELLRTDGCAALSGVNWAVSAGS